MTMMSTAALGCIKASCLLFFSRVFRTGSVKLIGVILWTLLSIVVVWTMSFTIGLLFICGTHFDWVFTSIENSLKCANFTQLSQALSISDVIMDFLIMVFPIPLVRVTKMD